MIRTTFFKLLFFIVGILLVSIIFFDGSIYKKFFYVMSFICNFTLYEYIGLSFLKSKLYEDLVNFDILIYYLILYSIVLILIYFYLKVIRDSNSYKYDLKDIEYFFLTIVPVCNLVILMLLDEYSYKIGFVLIIVVILFDLCYVFFHKKIREKNISYYKNIFLVEKNEILKKELENEADFRRLKHDLKNMLYQVYSSIENKDYDNAIERLEKIMGENLVSQSSLSGITEIDYLLASKLRKMDSLNIKHDVVLQLPKDIELNEISIDFSAILGNLIDNAIEAVLRLDKILSPIIIKIIYRNDKINCSIENPSQEVGLDFDEDYIKSSKSNRYGVGISSIKMRVKKLKGFCHFKYENGFFKSLVIIPVK